MVSPFMPDDQKLAAVRELLPATGAGIYLNTATAGPLPLETARAMADLAAWEVRTGRADPSYEEETLIRMDEARATVAAVIRAGVDTVALTHGTTHGLNIAAWAIEWQPGDRLVTTNLEEPGVMAALRSLAVRRGLELTVVDVDAAGDDERTLAAFADAMNARTRLVLCSHVAWSTGLVLPVASIARLARTHDALVCIDGSQAAGAVPVDVAALDVDLYALPAQKWLLGPDGMGALYCRPGLEDRLRPAFAGRLGMADPGVPESPLAATARRFEATSFHAPSVVGVARSCGWLAMYVGLDWITNRAQRLAHGAADLLGAIPGVTVLTPVGRMATVVTFRIGGWPAEEARRELGARVFAIVGCVEALDAIRISTGFFNTEAEVARFCAAVDELAQWTPDTMPARRRLTILGQDD